MLLLPQLVLSKTNSDSDENCLGLQQGNFRRIAANGFGDPYNGYPHAMAWFKGHLYVGTTRPTMHYRGYWLREANSPRFGAVWPVRIPDEFYEVDLRAQIWRYNPVTDQWKQVFISPLGYGIDGFSLAICIGFRSMLVYQGDSDSSPALYAPTWGGHQTPEALMLRSEDGVSFDIVSDPGMGFPEPYKPRAVRGLVSFNGRMVTSPAVGAKRNEANQAGFLLIFETTDPSSNQWRIINEPGFGDPNNLTVFSMVSFNGYLYAGTMNKDGYQIWKTDGKGTPPYHWTKVITHGAFRGKQSQIAMFLQPFKDSLYVGSAIQDGGFDWENQGAYAATEIVRIFPDDSWDLVVGEPRITPQGLKVPLSGLGPGFENPFSGYLWSMCAHDGWLYAGTFDWSCFLKYASPSEVMPYKIRQMVSSDEFESMSHEFGGFDMWRSRDGVRWINVTRNGFGNIYNYGARNMVSTPHGMFAGAANPFGPEVAVRRTAGWRYEPNPQGGLEIWHGSHQFTVDPSDIELSEEHVKTEIRFTTPQETKPIDKTARKEELLKHFFGGSEYRHLGFWGWTINNAREACDNLMEELLAFLPETSGTLINVNCGNGETTRYLHRYFPSDSITAVAMTRKHWEQCQTHTDLQSNLLFTKRSKLKEQNNKFDNAFFVNQIGGVNLTSGLLKEIYRCLKPGGRLVAFETIIGDDFSDEHRQDKLDRFRSTLHAIGYCDTQLHDIYKYSFEGFQKYKTNYIDGMAISHSLDFDSMKILQDYFANHVNSMGACMLISADKPLSSKEWLF